MWVRLRSSLPGEAIRSSTWKSSVSAQGIASNSPRIASIAQGLRPPLIASEKVLRSATAAAPIPAITSAARRAADFSSPATSRSMATAGRLGRLLVVAAELLAHRREHLAGEVIETARGKTLVERRGEDRCRHALVDRRD